MKFHVYTVTFFCFLAFACNSSAELSSAERMRLAVAASTDIIMGKANAVTIKTNAATNVVFTCKIGIFRPIKGTNDWNGVQVKYDDTVTTTNSLGSKFEHVAASGQNWILFLSGSNTLLRLDPPSKVQTVTDIIENKTNAIAGAVHPGTAGRKP